MAYELTMVFTVPDHGTFLDISLHIEETKKQFGLEPSAYCMTATGDEAKGDWAWVCWSADDHKLLDVVIQFWAKKFPDCIVERVHRINKSKFFERLVKKTRRSEVMQHTVASLANMASKGVTTAGMIEYAEELLADMELVVRELKRARNTPGPGKARNNKT